MNILAIYPGMNERCDNAHMLTRLLAKDAKLSVIACKSLGFKGKGALPEYENMAGIPIHRLFKDHMEMFFFPDKKLKECLNIASDLKPDLIFCSQELNMRLAISLQKQLRVPIVLLVEDAGRINSGETYSTSKFSFAMNLFGIPNGRKFWDWLCKRADALITCHPKDEQKLNALSRYNKPVYFLPWPTYVPSEFKFPQQREMHRGIYIGLLGPAKNTQVFERMLPRILNETPTEEFLVIGPGPHTKIIEKLQKETNRAVKHLAGVSRREALELIAGSYYAYTPVVMGGWGFIGDCWSMKTPLVMTHNDNYVLNEENALVAKDDDALITNIKRLYKNPELYGSLQQKGVEESQKKHAAVVGDQLYDSFAKTLSGTV